MGFWVGYLLNNAFVQITFICSKNHIILGGIPIGYLIGLAGTGLIMIHFLPEEKYGNFPIYCFLVLFLRDLVFCARTRISFLPKLVSILCFLLKSSLSFA